MRIYNYYFIRYNYTFSSSFYKLNISGLLKDIFSMTKALIVLYNIDINFKLFFYLY
ncbi:hypothetical protein CBOS2020_24840 [Clostridium botulinum]|nr:hypothetical protein CBOS2020_24840 [Clostridium botulinum]